MKFNSQLLLSIAVIAAIALSGFAVYKSSASSKLAYIELSKVFNEFKMTQEYKRKLESVVMSRKAITDSLEFDLKAKVRTINVTATHTDKMFQDYEGEKQLYMEKARRFEEDNLALKQEYDREIYKQLNQYIKDYGQKNGFHFIFGAEGSGVLMYAKEGQNVSEDIIKYINKRYEGGAK